MEPLADIETLNVRRHLFAAGHSRYSWYSSGSSTTWPRTIHLFTTHILQSHLKTLLSVLDPRITSYNFSQLVQYGPGMDSCVYVLCVREIEREKSRRRVSIAALIEAAVDGDRWCFSGTALLID